MSPPSSDANPCPNWRPITALCLGLTGFAAAVATLYATPIEGVTDLGCGLRVFDCSEALSQWGKIGGLPLGIFGGIYFTFWILSVGAWFRTRDDAFRSLFTWAMTIGVGVSMGLLVLLTFFVEGTCLYCLITHATNLAAAVLLWPMRRWKIDSAGGIAGRGLLILIATLIVGVGLFQLYQVRVDRAEKKADQQTIW